MKWIQWLLDNVWAVVIVGGVLLQLLQALTKKKGGTGDAAPAEPQAKEYEFEDAELAERTRKIREDIQRKIAQRSRGHAPEGVPLEDSEAPPPMMHEATVPPPRLPPTSRWDTQRQAEILEEQAAWAEKLAKAKSMKVTAQKRTAFEAATADHNAIAKGIARSSVLGDLRSPDALRRAFILREVLGPPVALRDGS